MTHLDGQQQKFVEGRINHNMDHIFVPKLRIETDFDDSILSLTSDYSGQNIILLRIAKLSILEMLQFLQKPNYRLGIPSSINRRLLK
jgi:hypothetical protein